jgi:hypothetical protein
MNARQEPVYAFLFLKYLYSTILFNMIIQGEEVKALNRMIFVSVIIAIAILAVYPVLLPPHVAEASVGAWENCLWCEGSDPPSWCYYVGCR